jgi:hypothetical protein
MPTSALNEPFVSISGVQVEKAAEEELKTA